MANLQKENLNNLNVLIIYISEAHAKNEWPISHFNLTEQHTNIEERINAAKNIFKISNSKNNNNIFSTSTNSSYENLNVVCDSFGDKNFESKFSAWPERAFLLKGKKLKYLSQHIVDGIDNWHEEVLFEIKKGKN